ncbi:MAG TPA: hypothetical protein VGD26_12115 [Chitinophagaceae bacterium]
MAQLVRPDGNITQTSFTGGFAEIDEITASDVDFAYGANNTAAVLEVSLGNITDPVSSTGHTFRYRIARTNAGVVDAGGNAVTVTAALYQGTTLIATDVAKTATGTWTQYAYTLAGAEADAITDYTDLRLRFTTSASGGGPSLRRGAAVSWAELESPDAPTLNHYTLDALPGSFTLTGQAAELAKGFVIAADAGTFTITGNAADLLYNPVLDAVGGSFTITGNPVDLTVSSGLSIDALGGVLTMTGQSADLLVGRVLQAESGSFTVVGNITTFLRGIVLQAVSGIFTLTGRPAILIAPGQGQDRKLPNAIGKMTTRMRL